MEKRILVIEDEKDIAYTIKYALELEDYSVCIASNGEEGLISAREGRPDLIILDLKLPELPGEDVCREIRKDERISKVPIIMLTGKDSDVDRVIGKVLGADCYMVKPFDLDDLLEKIDYFISSRGQNRT